MKKRDARGTLRDYKEELEGEFLSVSLSFLKCSKVFNSRFSLIPFFENGHLPGGFPPFHKGDAPNTPSPVSTAESLGISAVLYRSDKTDVAGSIVKPISVDMVNECPSISWFAFDIIMDKIITKTSIPMVALIEFYPNKFTFIDVFVYLGVSYYLVFKIIKRHFNIRVVDDSIMDNNFGSYWRVFDHRIRKLSVSIPMIFSSLFDVFIGHKSILTRVIKFHKEEFLYG